MARDILHHPECYEYNRNEVMTKGGHKLWIKWTTVLQYNEAGQYIGVPGCVAPFVVRIPVTPECSIVYKACIYTCLLPIFLRR